MLGLPCFRLAIFVYIVSEISSDSPTSATQGKSSGSPVFSLLLDRQYFSRHLSPTLSPVQQRGLLDYLLYSYSYILIIKPTRCTDFSNLFFGINLHVSDSSSVQHKEFFIVHTEMVYVIHILLSSCQQYLYDIYHWCVYSEKTLDDGQRNCPKHVEFYSKNKYEKLVHLVGFIIRIYHHARSPERQIYLLCLLL